MMIGLTRIEHFFVYNIRLCFIGSQLFSILLFPLVFNDVRRPLGLAILLSGLRCSLASWFSYSFEWFAILTGPWVSYSFAMFAGP